LESFADNFRMMGTHNFASFASSGMDFQPDVAARIRQKRRIDFWPGIPAWDGKMGKTLAVAQIREIEAFFRCRNLMFGGLRWQR